MGQVNIEMAIKHYGKWIKEGRKNAGIHGYQTLQIQCLSLERAPLTLHNMLHLLDNILIPPDIA